MGFTSHSFLLSIVGPGGWQHMEGENGWKPWIRRVSGLSVCKISSVIPLS